MNLRPCLLSAVLALPASAATVQVIPPLAAPSLTPLSSIDRAVVPHLTPQSQANFLEVAQPLAELGPVLVLPTAQAIGVISQVGPHVAWVRTDGSAHATTALTRDDYAKMGPRLEQAQKSGNYSELFSFLGSIFDQAARNAAEPDLAPAAQPAGNIGQVMIPSDKEAWSSARGNRRFSVFARLDSSALDAGVSEALANSGEIETLYRRNSKIHRLAQRLIAPVAARGDRARNFQYITHYWFNGSGSTIQVELLGSKSAIGRVLGGVPLAKAWLARPGEAIAGNRLYMASPAAHEKYVTGASTVYLRRGQSPWLHVGPAEIKPTFAGAPENLPIEIESVTEVPYSRVGRDVLEGLSPGLTLDEMARDMRGYYPPKPGDPGFLPSDIVTVVRLRRR